MASLAGPEIEAALRRMPKTMSSEQLVDQILDGAAALVERVGSDRVTTTDIATSAGVAVGSVYRYFPDRVAVLIALGLRNQRRLHERFVDAFKEQPQTLDDAAEMFFAAFVDSYRYEPSVRSLGTGDWIDLGSDGVRTSWGVVAAPAVDALANLHGVPRALAFATIATLCTVTDALLQVAFRDHQWGDPALLLHARILCGVSLQRALH